MAAICVVHEIADEVLGCRGTSQRMMIVSDDVRNHVDAYVPNGHSVLRMMALLDKELVIRKERFSNNQVKRFSTGVTRALRNARVNSHNVLVSSPDPDSQQLRVDYITATWKVGLGNKNLFRTSLNVYVQK